MIASSAAPAIAYVLVNASGPNRRPSCPSRVKIGINDNVIISRLINSAGPTSTDASVITCQRVLLSSVASGCWCCHSSSRLCAFSIMTIAASTIAPTAIAMPPNDIILAFSPWKCMTIKAIHNPSGNEIIATSAERTCQRNSAQTTATTINSSSNLPLRLSMARSMSWLRSYVVTISTPSGRLLFSVSSLSFTAAITSRAFLPERRITTPPATSPSPLSSAMPRRISGPIWTFATSRR